ncbi:RluA family pseudouridine synthase [Marinilactibacillus kalidii]|uniref:RluA family pseudouridine synthase n=1 Tax=Marinilactibacillus kalidii TaxID=2820274 RepID=UPI001ABED369
MIIEWIYEETEQIMLKTFLKEKAVSKKMLAKVKFKGGQLEVNGKNVRVREILNKGDVVKMSLPIEPSNPHLIPSFKKIDILFEDDHYLIINKASGVASVPSPTHREDTMANRIRGYVENQQYEHKTVHVVTRLDRETSGAMIFAKHAFAHSMIDLVLRRHEIDKTYQAVVSGRIEKEYGLIKEPIGRTEDSIITRMVREDGRPSLTEYWLSEYFDDASFIKVKLHTGRTHQIRVHFSYLNHPLVGDDLYGENSGLFTRQALHCSGLSFVHPFSREEIQVTAPLPTDMTGLIEKLRGN